MTARGFQPVDARSPKRGNRPKKARVTVVERVYFQPLGPVSQPTAISSTFCRELDTDEQPYVRHYVCGEQWQPLVQGGWLNEASMMIVANEEGRDISHKMTPEEKAAVAARVLEISHGNGPEWFIPSTESMRACPARLDELYVRCRVGQAHYSVALLPK